MNCPSSINIFSLNPYDVDQYIVNSQLTIYANENPPSFMNYLNQKSPEISRRENKNLWEAIGYLFKEMAPPFNSLHLDEETIDQVILPTLFARSMLVRRPDASNPEEIKKALKYYVDDSADPNFKTLLEVGGHRELPKSLRSCFVLQPLFSKQIYGLIDYKIKNQECTVKSLKVDKLYQRQNLATLLLSTAISNAKFYNCSKVSVCTTTEGVAFYDSLSFIPEPVKELPDHRWWSKVALNSKCEMISCGYQYDLDDFIFDMSDYEILKNKVQKALAWQVSEKRIEKEECKVLIFPKEAMELGWLDNIDLDYEIEEDAEIPMEEQSNIENESN